MVVEAILRAKRKQMFEGISTKKIYIMVFSLLNKTANSHAARYDLSEAI